MEIFSLDNTAMAQKSSTFSLYSGELLGTLDIKRLEKINVNISYPLISMYMYMYDGLVTPRISAIIQIIFFLLIF